MCRELLNPNSTGTGHQHDRGVKGRTELNPPLSPQTGLEPAFWKPPNHTESGSTRIPRLHFYEHPDSSTTLVSWGARILSTLSSVQMALTCDYKCMAVMHAMHKIVHRVYFASPWAAENTMRSVYAIAHHQPCTQQAAIEKLVQWLFCNAKWQGTNHTDMTIPTELQPEGYNPVGALIYTC